MENLFGTITMVVQLSIVLIGLPLQIYKNHKEKHSGISTFIAVQICILHISRFTYGKSIGSYYLMIPDLLGGLLAIVLLTQAVIYRKRKPTSTGSV